MKYLYLELNGYKRMALAGQQHFSITITDPLQIILGTNGSGKSSMLGELSPLPGQHTDFLKEGSKIFKVLHNGVVYTLTSTFAPSQRHSFKAGEEELNKGGTVTVQRDLVKTYFGITPDIHELMLGRQTFTGFSPAKRKEWFLRLCDTNYDYAIKVYNNVRDKHRDTTGALRITKRRLVQESEKLIDTEEEARLRAETKALHEQLNFLLEVRKPVEKDPEVLVLAQEQLDRQLFKLADTLQTLAKGHTAVSGGLEAITESIAAAQRRCVSAKTLIGQFSTTHEKNAEKISALEKAEKQTIEQLQGAVDALAIQRAALQQRTLVTLPSNVSAGAAMSAFQSVKITLNDIFSALPANESRRFSSDALAQARQSLSDATVLKTKQVETLQRHRAKLAHLSEHKDHPDMQCPSCEHRYSLKYNQIEFDSLTQSAELLAQRLECETQPHLAALQTYIEECLTYAQNYRQYVQCVNSWPGLQPYWDYLADTGLVVNEPSSGSTILERFHGDLLLQLELDALERTLRDKQELLASLRDVGGADLLTLLEQNKELSECINAQTSLLQSATGEIEQLTQRRQRAVEIQNLRAKAVELIQAKRNLNKEEIEAIRRTELNALIRQMQSALASREHVLGNLNLQKKAVEALVTQIAELEVDAQCFAVLVKQLSPTEGLIAEGLLGFIKNFVMQMNSLIRKVWSYPLVIQSCEITSDDTSVDLDYYFPMAVNSPGNIVLDVAHGSSGMREIVNLAFVFTAMRYLGLNDCPIDLDEFGHSFDEEHRGSAMLTIKSLMEAQPGRQVFIISHYEGWYGSFANAQICVLNDMNIVVPKGANAINAHVTRR